MARSTDGGATFDIGRDVSDVLGNEQGSTIAVGLDGSINIAWLRSNFQITFDRCTINTMGVISCGADRVVAEINRLSGTLPGTAFRVNSNPSLAIDTAPGGSGYLAMVWADDSYGTADIWFTLSQNGGQTWLQPKRITLEPVDEFFPSITIDSNHIQHVVYYRRTTQENTCCGDCLISGSSPPAFGQDGIVDSVEKQRCTDILNGVQPLAHCPQCDCNGNGQVSAGELTNVILNEGDGCGRFNLYSISSPNSLGNFTEPTIVNSVGPIAPTNHLSGRFIGDYIGIDSTTVRNPIWMDSRREVPQGFTGFHQQDVYTAPVTGC